MHTAEPAGNTEKSLNGFRLDHAVLTVVGFLTVIGMTAIFAASSLKGAQQFHNEYFFITKQLAAFGVGAIALLIILFAPFQYIERMTMPFLALTLFLLALIFVPGAYTNISGASRWLNVPVIGGQPGELAKLAIVLFLAKSLSRRTSDLQNLRAGILPNLLVFGALTGLLLMQKDLGTPAVMFFTAFAMLFAAGLPRRFIVWLSVSALILFVTAIALEPYRVARLASFLDPWAEARGSGFQIIQSFLAFQNGGLLGAGLGESRQKLFFLPEAHTDFILAVIGEELGLGGSLVVTLGFFVLAWLGFQITMQQQVTYRKFLALGLTLIISLQALLNMGVTMGLLPTKGITLPFISSGTSSLLVFLVISAILAKLGRELYKVENGCGTPKSV